MQIAYISNSLIPSRFASVVHVMKMCQSFSELGHKTKLFAIKNGSLNQESIFEGYNVSPGAFDLKCIEVPKIKVLGPQLFYTLKIKKYISEYFPNAELIYGRQPSALLGLANLHIPIVYEAHGLPLYFHNELIVKKLLSSSQLKMVVVISEALKKMFLEKYPWFEKKIVVAHDGADDPLNYSAPSRGCEWSGNLGSVQVGYVGHLYPGRGIELILELSKKCQNIDFHVIGGTDDLIQYWRKHNLRKNLFFHGFMSNKEVQKTYPNFDIVLAPYQKKVGTAGNKRGDTSKFMSPLKIFEYMSWGKAIVASDLPVLHEVLKDNYNALLVHPESVDAWYAAIQSLISNHILKERLENNARKVFLENYTWRARAEKLIKDFRNCAN